MTVFFQRNALLISVLLLLGLSPFQINAREEKQHFNDLKLSVNYHQGYSLPEYSIFTLLTNEFTRAIDINISKDTKGLTKWEQLYNYPGHGLSLFYASLGNDEIFGRELALNYFVKLYMYSKNKLHLFNRTGVGLGYVSKTYDPENNYLNVVVGAHFNIHFNFRVGATYDVSEKISLNGGVSFDHISNANTASPNVGINSLSLYSGVNYQIGAPAPKQEKNKSSHKKINDYYLFFGLGGKHTQALSANYFLTSSVSFEVKRQLTPAFHLGLGADVFFDSSAESQLKKQSRMHTRSNDFQTGLHFSQTLFYNRFSLALQQGIYLGLTEKVGGNLIYNKGVLQYNIVKNVSARIVMKSHLHILDYPEFGIGIKL